MNRGSSVRDGWLSFIFGDETDYRRRLFVAYAVAIAILEVIAGIISVNWHARPSPDREVVSNVSITQIRHRVVPTPKPTPKPIVHTHVIAPAHVVPTTKPGSMSPNQHVPRHAQKRPIARTIHHLALAHIHVPTGGQGASTSSGKALTGGAGTGGTGTGTGGTGNGTGGISGTEPCGFVEFVPTGNNEYDRSTGGFNENIRMTVHFPDGTSQSVDLDYPWYYASEAADPWSQQNLRNANFPVTFQQPPPDKVAGEPSLVQYVTQHSSADGYTRLKDCPAK
ncbi:MAG: hypothetical protein M3R35_00660 [Candidatus Eremiobacteraeota bacterium]|nr:hypothetical protein [Candidatus Eremiobacteraeota bacterium]